MVQTTETKALNSYMSYLASVFGCNPEDLYDDQDLQVGNDGLISIVVY